MIPNRRTLLLGAGASLVATPIVADPEPSPVRRPSEAMPLTGRPVQGGFVFGRTTPGAAIEVDVTPTASVVLTTPHNRVFPCMVILRFY